MADPPAASILGETTPLVESTKDESRSGHWVWRILGPGIFVCLADTDAGCLVVAAQSGARWGYSLLLLQVALVPILFFTQELTVRLGVYTRQGHTACIRMYFGPRWAWFATALLAAECTAAMISEMSGVGAVAQLWGINTVLATIMAAAVIVLTVLCCSYRQIEAIGVTLGLFELVFVFSMFAYHPSAEEAVVMPWMIYFQQSAIVARKLVTREHLKAERFDTALGSILTQLVMIGTLVTLAANHHHNRDLDSVEDIVAALEPAMGYQMARVMISLGFLGGSLCASFVVSLAAAWAVCEAMGESAAQSLDAPCTSAPAFYGPFLCIICIGVGILLYGVNVVALNILVELLDGLLLPFAIGFLFLLSTSEALPPEVRVVGMHKLVLGMLFGTCVLVSFGSAIYGLVGRGS
mmetsp:Transcript_88477/g.228133  ORF Transcript_88477/g.228133 Transcript_88477/m.228133 type:complete len:409 (-) Transcript_88477:186-1412(-)